MLRRHPSRSAVATIAAALAMVLTSGPTSATEVTVTSSYPAVYEFTPPADRTLEGSRIVTATADGPLVPLETYSWLTSVNPQVWTTRFLWHETAPRVARFVDAAGDTLAVAFAPAVVTPLDLSRHHLPVIHIQTAPADLWDQETGLYVWGNHDNFLQRGDAWERPATIAYYDRDGSLAFSEPIGLRINGESSREYAQKGLRLYFDDYGDSDVIEHDFFGDGPVRCERLVLRGNRYPDFAISSGLMEPLHQELGHPGSRWAYVAVYLNDEYWGAYSLRERLDSKWVETTHDWADDGYVIVKDHEAEAGDYARWLQFLAGCQPPAAFDSHGWYQWLQSELDVTSYLDWILVNACGMSADNMAGKNLAILKLGGQPFRFMTWDEDILYQTGNRDADHLAFYASGDAAEYAATRPPVWFSGGPWDFTFTWNNLLRAGMQNAEFKAALRQRAADLLTGALSAAALDARLDALAAVQGPEWVHHDLRWNAPGTYAAKVATVRAQFAYRTQKVRDQVAAFLATWADPVELSSFTAATTPDGVRLSWHTERETGCLGWVVERSAGEPNAFAPIASYLDHAELAATGGADTPADYQWTDSAPPSGVDLFYRLSHADAAGVPVAHDWIERIGPPPTCHLRLNEILADNDHVNVDEAGEYDDWVEVVNLGAASVSLAGLYLSDRLDDPTMWMLPAVDLGPGGFVLIWCDEDAGQGPLHANFKLSADGESVGLFASLADGNQLIDAVTFGPQSTDVSLGRAGDGTGPWVPFTTPTPGASNQPSSAVGEPDAAGASLGLGRPWPNPAAGDVSIAGRLPATAHDASLRIFDARGREVRHLWSGTGGGEDQRWTWNGRDDAGRPVPAGVYFLRLSAAGERSQRRVVVMR